MKVPGTVPEGAFRSTKPKGGHRRIVDDGRRVVEYYVQTEKQYRWMWDTDQAMALHYGHWAHGARNHGQAMEHMNAEVGRRAEIRSADRVLDAGCGVGGTAIHFARAIGCEIIGINVVDVQLEICRGNAERHGVSDRVRFYKANYLDTQMKDSSFDAVLFIESSCHAQDKKALVVEAFRLLRAGGRLVVADYFRPDRHLTEEENGLLRSWEEAWSMAHLWTIEDFEGAMRSAGFREVVNTDETRHIAPSARRMYYQFFFGIVMKTIRRLWRRHSHPRKVQNVWAARTQELARQRGLWSYRIVSGLKGEETSAQ